MVARRQRRRDGRWTRAFEAACLGLAAVWAFSTPAYGQSRSTTGSDPGMQSWSQDSLLEALVAEGLQNNPDVAAALAAVDAAVFRVGPAKTLPDPFLAFNYQNDGSGFTLGTREGSFLGTMLSQPIPWPGKLGLAGGVARSDANRIRAAGLGRARLAVEGRIRRAFYDHLLAKQLLDLIEDRRRTWQQIEGTVRERYAAGLAVQQDLFRTQVEILRLEEARADQQAALANRRAELNRAVGRSQDALIGPQRSLEYRDTIPDFAALLPSVRGRSPELQGALEWINTGRLKVRLARRDFLPDFVISGGPMFRGPLDPMWQIGLGVSLPIYAPGRQRNRLQEAKSIFRSAEAATRSVDQELELRTRERVEQLRATLRVARLYREGVLPVDELSLEAALTSYRTGRVPFVTVLDALSTLYADRANYLARLADAEKWRVAIDEVDLQASGGMEGAGTAPQGAAAAPSGSSGQSSSMSQMK